MILRNDMVILLFDTWKSYIYTTFTDWTNVRYQMLDERLFFFIHGMATMFFIVTGLAHFRNKNTSRLKKLCGYVLLYWAFLEIIDLALYIFPLLRGNYSSNLLILVDMTAIPAGCFFVIELLNAGWCTLRRAALLLFPFVLSVVAYAVAPYD